MQAPLHVDCGTRRVLLHAIETAGAPARLTIEGLFLSLLALDCGFVFRKLRRTRVRPPDMVRDLHARRALSPAGDSAGTLSSSNGASASPAELRAISGRFRAQQGQGYRAFGAVSGRRVDSFTPDVDEDLVFIAPMVGG